MRSTGSWYEVKATDGQVVQCRLRGKMKLKDVKMNNPVAVGDWVEYELEADGKGIVSRIMPRENYIMRQSVHKSAHGHILAANIDQAVLVATLVFPRTSLGFMDRFLVTAESFRIPTVLVFNKTDLLEADGLAYQDQLTRLYESLDYACIQTSVSEKTNLDAFREILKDKKSLLAGHSGVGKSSLVNFVNPQLRLRTSEVSTFANKGVHTTTFAEMFELQPDTYIIDTPGIKELGLADTEPWEIGHYFPEMRDRMADCRYHNCTHAQEPGCAVLEAVENGQIAASRYTSYLSMLAGGDNRR